MNALAARDANNVRLYKHDAVEVLEHEIAPGTLAEARIWFPDPWHKKRHNKRRLIQPEFVPCSPRAWHRRPAASGHRLATYAEHMLEVMEAAPAWRNAVGPGQYAEKARVAHRNPLRTTRPEAWPWRVGSALPQALKPLLLPLLAG
jgi:tRNA (guanine-N7-)-methyltransferase